MHNPGDVIETGEQLMISLYQTVAFKGSYNDLNRMRYDAYKSLSWGRKS